MRRLWIRDNDKEKGELRKRALKCYKQADAFCSRLLRSPDVPFWDPCDGIFARLQRLRELIDFGRSQLQESVWAHSQLDTWDKAVVFVRPTTHWGLNSKYHISVASIIVDSLGLKTKAGRAVFYNKVAPLCKERGCVVCGMVDRDLRQCPRTGCFSVYCSRKHRKGDWNHRHRSVCTGSDR